MRLFLKESCACARRLHLHEAARLDVVNAGVGVHRGREELHAAARRARRVVGEGVAQVRDQATDQPRALHCALRIRRKLKGGRKGKREARILWVRLREADALKHIQGRSGPSEEKYSNHHISPGSCGVSRQSSDDISSSACFYGV